MTRFIIYDQFIHIYKFENVKHSQGLSLIDVCHLCRATF